MSSTCSVFEAVTSTCSVFEAVTSTCSVFQAVTSTCSVFQADELNVPAYLQRYLVHAQRNYLQQQNRQLLHDNDDDIITTDISSTALPSTDISSTALPSTDDLPPPLHYDDHHYASDFIVPDTGELREDLTFSGDCASDGEDHGCLGLKSSCAGKPSKSSSAGVSSKANSKQNSRNNSRQSSRNSRVAQHSSIEDVDAEDEDGEGEGAGSQWGGSSSNRSNSFVDRNDNLKKSGLSIIHVGGTTSDPAFEMIVPYDEAFEEVGLRWLPLCRLVVLLVSSYLPPLC